MKDNCVFFPRTGDAGPVVEDPPKDDPPVDGGGVGTSPPPADVPVVFILGGVSIILLAYALMRKRRK